MCKNQEDMIIPIAQTGIYIIKGETETGFVTRKVFVK